MSIPDFDVNIHDLELIAEFNEEKIGDEERVNQLSSRTGLKAIEEFVQSQLNASSLEKAFYQKFQQGFAKFEAAVIQVEHLRQESNQLIKFVKEQYQLKDTSHLKPLESLEFNGDLQKFQDDTERCRIQIARYCLCFNDGITITNIAQFRIRTQKGLLEIAKHCAGRMPATFHVFIPKMNFDRLTLIEFLKFFGPINGRGVLKIIDKLGITDQKALAEIFRLCCTPNHSQWLVALFRKFGIQDSQLRLELLEFCARIDGAFTLLFIDRFDVHDPAALRRVKELCYQQMGVSTAIEWVKQCAQKDSDLLANHITLTGITDPAALLEIAKICAQQNGKSTANCVANFGIKNEKDRIDLLKLCAENDELDWRCIEKFKIQDESEILKIVESCAKKDPATWASMVEDVKIGFQDKLRLWLICLKRDFRSFIDFPQDKTHLKLDNPTIDDILKCLKHYGITCSPAIASFLNPLTKEPGENLKDFEMRQERHSDIIKLLGATIVLMEQTLSPPQMEKVLQSNLLTSILYLPRPDLRWGLIVEAIEDAKSEHFGKNPEKKPHWHEILKLLLDRARSQGCSEAVINQIQMAGKHSYFKDGKHHQPLIEALLLLVQNEEIDPAAKNRLLTKLTACFVKDKKVEENSSMTKNTTRAEINLNKAREKQAEREKLLLFSQNVNELLPLLLIGDPTICEANDDRTLGALMQASFEKMLPLQVQNFSEKYAKTFGASRSPLSIVIYASKMKRLNDKKIMQDIGTFMGSVMEGTFLANRHAIDKNPQLQKISQNHSKVYEKWIQQEPSFSPSGAEKLVVIDSEEPMDLLLAGSEVIGSCQSLNGDPHLSKGLLGYLLDGKNRLIEVKSKNDPEGKILGRALLKLLWDGEKPVLFLERIYLNQHVAPAYNQAIVSMALRKAQTLGLDLVSLDTGFIEYGKPLVSLGSPASFEYSDANNAVIPQGTFTVHTTYRIS